MLHYKWPKPFATNTLCFPWQKSILQLLHHLLCYIIPIYSMLLCRPTQLYQNLSKKFLTLEFETLCFLHHSFGDFFVWLFS